jgi:hypothetical protein
MKGKRSKRIEGRVKDLMAESNYPLCDLVRRSLSKIELPTTFIWFAVRSRLSRANQIELAYSPEGRHDAPLSLNILAKPGASDVGDKLLCQIQRYSTTFFTDPVQEFRYPIARQINATLDPGVIQEWLKICTTQHSSACRPTTLNPPLHCPIFMIDVATRCIVSVIQDDRLVATCYAALSYVWGPESVSQLKNTREVYKLDNAAMGSSRVSLGHSDNN